MGSKNEICTTKKKNSGMHIQKIKALVPKLWYPNVLAVDVLAYHILASIHPFYFLFFAKCN